MKILLISDVEDKWLGECHREEPPKVDLIISCGDLDPGYLEYLVTVINKPLLYVHGNHDEIYDSNPPLGCTSIEDDIFVFNGIRFLGLGGSMKYNDKKYMYTEKQMSRRIFKLWWKLFKNRGFDVLVSHAPSYGNGDLSDLPHRGFMAFNRLINRYKPLYHFHGHVHSNYGSNFLRERLHESGAIIINASGKYILEI